VDGFQNRGKDHPRRSERRRRRINAERGEFSVRFT
jgi:hypothetical protein